MLARLSISNFIHVDLLTLDFERGACAITGETGVGKSVLLEALKAVLGDRVGPDVVRTGAALALVEARFETSDPRVLAWREAHGVDPLEDDRSALTLAREISDRGSRCRVDGRLVTSSALRELGDLLVEACGQHDQVLLSRPSRQLEALDDFAGATDLRARCEAAHKEAAGARARLDEARQAAERRARERDFWAFQAAEIDQGQLEDPGEPARLAEEARVLGSAATLRQAAATDSRLQTLADRLAEAQTVVEDAVRELRRYSDALEEDDERLFEIETRRDLLGRLLRKYGPTIHEALVLRSELETHLRAAGEDDQTIASLSDEVRSAESALESAAGELSAARRQAANALREALAGQLGDLAMGGARLEVRILPLDSGPGPHGSENVEFLFAPNLGEPARPLGKIASGGELSRLMLALKVVMIDASPVSTLVFDEIDAGISGSAAQKVARKLAKLAERHQVLIVTHLPTIAAVADRHVHLDKLVEDGRTRLQATVLTHEGRIRELAHLLSGEGGSKAAAGAASELLEKAKDLRA